MICHHSCNCVYYRFAFPYCTLYNYKFNIIIYTVKRHNRTII